LLKNGPKGKGSSSTYCKLVDWRQLGSLPWMELCQHL
jgi:hypothetical protein